MDCKDIVRCLSDYIDGELPIEVLEQAEKHMAECPKCSAAMHTLRETIQAYKLTGKAHIAPEHRASMLSAIKEAVRTHTD